MHYVKTINEDGVVSDIMAKALDPTLDAAVLKRTNLQNDFTQTEAGVNALDAAAGKTLNDSLANTNASITNLKNGMDAFSGVSLDIPGSSNDVSVQISNNGFVNMYGATGGNAENMQVHTYLQDRYGAISSRYRTRTSESDAWGDWSPYGYMYPIRHKDVNGTTDSNGYINLGIDVDTTLPILADTRKGGGTLSDRFVEFTSGANSWWGRVTYKGATVASTAIKFRIWYFDAQQTLV